MLGKAYTGLLILINISWSCARQTGCDERGPICGNDGKTYETMCQLIWARLEDTDLQVLHEGSCTGQYPDNHEEVTMLSHKFDGAKHLKIKALMPYGWPPLGPVVQRLRNMLKTGEERKTSVYSPKKV